VPPLELSLGQEISVAPGGSGVLGLSDDPRFIGMGLRSVRVDASLGLLP
jgi:hypothetical protein